MKVYSLSDGCWLVRGTQDVGEAFAALQRDPDWADQVADLYVPEDSEYDVEFAPDRADPNLYRFNPCHCGDEHSWDLGYSRTRKQGVFDGVLFEGVKLVPIEYDDGLDNDPWLEETGATQPEERVSA